MVDEKETQETEKAPRTVPNKGRATKPAATEESTVTEEPNAKASKSNNTREIVSEGEKFEVEVVLNEEGSEVVKESVYRTVNLPNSSRTTKRLIKAAGTRLY